MLSDLGTTIQNVKIKKACDVWINRLAKKDGGFGVDEDENSELCLTGNTTRALVKLGYSEHPIVKSGFEWIVRNQKENGGWHCWGKNGVIDACEGMSAFASYPREKWTKSMKAAVEKGAEFYLQRKLHREGRRYEPWYRLHYPVHYYYDILVGLDMITALGYNYDPRLREAFEILESKMRDDGKWLMDSVHPDVPYALKPKSFFSFSLEQPGKPSKMITLRAMIVLKRIEERK